MSDGKKFSPKSLGTAEERLDEIERKYSVIQDRIQAYDQVLAEFANISSDLKTTKSNFNTLIKSCNSLANDSKEKFDQLFGLIQLNKNKTEGLYDVSEANKKFIESFVANNQKIYNQFDSVLTKLKVKIENLEEDHGVSLSNLNEIEKKLSRHSAVQGENSNIINNLIKDYLTLEKSCLNANQKLSDKITKLESKTSDIPSFVEWSNKVYGRISQDILFKEKQTYAYIDKKIDEVSKDLRSDPASAESIKADLQNQLENLSIDGRNAYLKSSNCAQQIQLLEKKLENLNLIMKKYELSK